MNCKIGKVYYSFEYLVRVANKLGYNKDKKACFFLQHNIFGDNIYNPSIIFDTEKHEWTKPVTIKQL